MTLMAENVSFSYGDKTIFDGVNLSLEPGKIYGLLGANGSGKSTFMQVLSGFLQPSSGRVMLNGRVISDYSQSERAGLVSFHSQMPEAPEFLTLFQIVEMAGYFGEVVLEDVEKAISHLKLEAIRDSLLGKVSGGERQRAFLARAFAQGTGVTLWDEPMSNLDPAYQLLLADVLRGLADKSAAVFASFHDVTLAANLCDSLVFFKAGQPPLIGNTTEMIREDVLKEVFGVNFAVNHEQNGWFCRAVS